MTHPSVNSIVERLAFVSRSLALIDHRRVVDEAATIISELQAELWHTKNDLANAHDNYHEVSTRLESSLSRIKEETIEALRPFAALLAAIECTTCHAMADGDTWSAPDDAGIVKISDLRKAAEVYRSLGSTGGAEKTAESDHSPSTSTTATE